MALDCMRKKLFFSVAPMSNHARIFDESLAVLKVNCISSKLNHQSPFHALCSYYLPVADGALLGVEVDAYPHYRQTAEGKLLLVVLQVYLVHRCLSALI